VVCHRSATYLIIISVSESARTQVNCTRKYISG
jgi:hypothetical protein